VLRGLVADNVVAMVLETVVTVRQRAPEFFFWFEVFSVFVFTVEYVLRPWAVTVDPRYAHPVRGRIRYAVTPLLLIDLLAVLPFYLPYLGVDLRVFRAARLFRIFRVAKLGRYSHALQTFGRVIHSTREQLMTTLMLLLTLLLFSATLLYYAENQAQPEAFSSIPMAMWWGIATLTTVGYGDVYPITGIGRLMAAAIAILGIGMFALPTGILGSAFVEEIQNRGRSAPMTCPHCGREITSAEVRS
jgi:voltage-gated potassium channel